MSLLFVLRVTSVLLVIVSGFMGISAAVGLAYGELSLLPAFAVPIGASILFFVTMQMVVGRRGRPSLSVRGSYLFVSLAWLLAAALGALPMVISGAIPRYVDAFFETMSGFTTSGASILTDIEVLPRGILFWRSMTHWLGGMGIVVLTVAVFPLLGIGGVRLLGAESPGPTVDKVTPRVTTTAAIFWGIYVLLTAAQVLLLLAGGMDLFDATTHTFGTLATGGFSTRNASIGAFSSAYVDAVVTVFMLLAAANFALFYRIGRGRWSEVSADSELRAYLAIIVVAIALVTVDLARGAGMRPAQGLRYASFQVASILSTTGYVTADYTTWPALSQIVLFVLMFVGGCAGSTGGGVKVVRFVMLFKQAAAELRYQIWARGVFSVRVNGKAVRKNVIYGVYAFVFTYFAIILLSTVVVASGGYDIATSITASLATVGNIGPGFARVGPTANYAHFPDLIKVWFSLAMVTGRLEVYTVLLLLTPSFWKR